jgi:hypothetical protein
VTEPQSVGLICPNRSNPPKLLGVVVAGGHHSTWLGAEAGRRKQRCGPCDRVVCLELLQHRCISIPGLHWLIGHKAARKLFFHNDPEYVSLLMA